MTKISINLLPVEFKNQEIKAAKFYKIQAYGIAFILLMILISSLTVALRVIQSKKVAEVQSKYDQSFQRVSDLKNTQASLLILKNRLVTITQYWQTSSKQVLAYELVSKLIPTTVSIGSISVDDTGKLIVSAIAPDGVTADSVITNLTSKSTNENKISAVSIDSINRGEDGLYRLSFSISTN